MILEYLLVKIKLYKNIITKEKIWNFQNTEKASGDI